MSKRVGIAAASVGVISFVAYCIYFDRKRRSAPDFKKRLRERKYIALRMNIASVNNSCGTYFVSEWYFMVKICFFLSTVLPHITKMFSTMLIFFL